MDASAVCCIQVDSSAEDKGGQSYYFRSDGICANIFEVKKFSAISGSNKRAELEADIILGEITS